MQKSLEYIFYEAQQGASVESVCAVLIEKIYESGQRIVVYSPIIERLKSLNNILWTYKQLSFIPHGMEKGGNANLNPVWLSTTINNLNSAKVLIVLDDYTEPCDADVCLFEKIVYLVVTSDQNVSNHHDALKEHLTNNHRKITRWVQQKNGCWQKG